MDTCLLYTSKQIMEAYVGIVRSNTRLTRAWNRLDILYEETEALFKRSKACLLYTSRTLQTLRDRRLIGYSQINRRFYYKPEEVKRLIPLVGTLYPHGR